MLRHSRQLTTVWALALLGACGGGSGGNAGTPPTPAAPLLQNFVGTPSTAANDRTTLFDAPAAMVADGAGNLYVSDQKRGVILAINAQGVTSVYAGQPYVIDSTDGDAAHASFIGPSWLALDAAGNLYVADQNEQIGLTIRKISPQRQVSTVMRAATWSRKAPGGIDGPSGTATFAFGKITGLAVASDGTLYAASDLALRQIGADGRVTTVAGGCDLTGEHDGDQFCAHAAKDGLGTKARFARLGALRAGADGALYALDAYAVRRYAPGGQVTTLAGQPDSSGPADGASAVARFGKGTPNFGVGITTPAVPGRPTDLMRAADGSLYVIDTANDAIRKIDGNGQVSTYATGVTLSGTDGLYAGALLTPSSLALLSHNAVQKLTLK
ncbi:NHL repeat-containing protein [Rugamonas aquatica]|uniref:SMP-30/Gluconolactonase/LRE-like region domain-containing protein n=1 Tax=Rugamonas aquatica TaxID=2743357 RepID=A0A6A7N5Z9_9BURK|nr:hypothetical protein [Rugamonas aquatica]MQA40480.1 hypothetical protein [Rugamonas aquatica]